MLEVLSLSTGVVSLFCFICLSPKSFAIFQQCSYRPREYFYSYIKAQKREIVRLSTYSLVFLLISLVLAFVSGIFSLLSLKKAKDLPHSLDKRRKKHYNDL